MPEVDYALLADFVRVEGGVAHALAAGIDTIYAPQTPTGQNVGLLMRVAFVRNECGRPHRVEVIFQGEDGDRLAKIDATVEPTWDEHSPPGWKMGVLLGLNLGVPLPRYGIYSFEMLVNDSLVKTIPLRVVPAAPQVVDFPGAPDGA